ncbi:hypothetical protein SPFM12_00129 [Salmonella phage SPFM12]|nr:hypothetical protein SPFM12_00129 [Salmonella phage SPFM12]
MMECNPYTKSAPKPWVRPTSAPVERFYVDRFVYYDAYLGAPTGVIGLAVERNRVKSATRFDIVHDTWRYNRAVMFTLKPAVANLPATTLFGIMAHCVSEGTLFKKQNIPGGLVGTPYGEDKVTDPTKPVVVEFLGTIISEFLDYLADLDANRLASADGISIVNWVSVGTVKPNVTDEYHEDGMSWTRPGMAGEAVGGNNTAFEQWNTPATGSPVYVYGRGYQSRYYGGPGGDWGQPGRYGLAGSRDKGGATQLVVAQFTAGGAPLGPGAAVPSGTNNRNIAGGGGGGDYYAFSTTKIGGDAIHITDTFRGKVTIENYGTGRGGSGMVYSLPANTSADGADELPQIGEVVWNFVNRGTILTVDAGAFVYRDSNLKPTFVISYWATTLTNHAACGRLFVNVYQDNEQTLNLNYTTTSQVSELAPVEGSYKVMGSATLNVARDVNEIAPVENLAGEWPRQVHFTGSLHDALAIETLGIRSVLFFSRNKLETYAGKTTYVPDDNSVVALTARPGSGMFGTKYVDKVDVSAPMSPEDIGQTSAYANKQQWINFYSNAVKRIVDLGDVDINTVYTVTNIILTLKAFQAKQTSLVWYGSQTLDVINLTDDFEDLPITWTNNAARITTCASIHELLPHLDTLLGITFQVTKQNIADYFAKVKLDAIPTLDVTLTGGPGYSNYGQITAAKAVDPANVRLVSVAHRDEKSYTPDLVATVIRSLNRKNAVI